MHDRACCYLVFITIAILVTVKEVTISKRLGNSVFNLYNGLGCSVTSRE